MSSLEKLEYIQEDKYWPARKKIIQNMIVNQKINVNGIFYQPFGAPLNESSHRGDAEFTEYLLQQNADVTKKTYSGNTSLIAVIERLKITHRDSIPASYNKIIKMLIFSHTESALNNIIHETGLNETYPHIKNLIEHTLAQKEIWHQLVSRYITQNPASIVADYSKPNLFFIEDDTKHILPRKNTMPMQLEEIDPHESID